MATQQSQLFSSNAGVGSGLRVDPKRILPGLFATGSGTLAKLTPVAFNTSTLQWVPWDADGANSTDAIRGFVWPDALTLDASDEVIGNILREGLVHFGDLPAYDDVDGAASAAAYNAALRAAQSWGLYVQEIPATT